MSFTRRLRATLTVALLWALAWTVLGAVVGFLLPPSGSDETLRDALGGLAEWAALGCVNGAGFAIVLALRERRKSVGSLKLGRVMLWGAFGSLLLPTSMVVVGFIAFRFSIWYGAILPLTRSEEHTSE